MLWLLKFVPKNHLSYLAGVILSIRFPKPIGSFLILQFAQLYKINLNEAEKDYTEYASINDFFVRKLKAGARPIGAAEVLHPADSAIAQAGIIHEGRLIQAKNKTYHLHELFQEDVQKEYEQGIFITYYLCPTDYHRVHSPVSGEIIETVHIPGALWPVNKASVEGVPDLFTVNERVISKIKTERGIVSLIFVGATNVGKIELTYDSEIISNDLVHRQIRRRSYSPAKRINKGDELGMFHMGSTVVMVYPESYSEILSISVLSSQMGQKVKVCSDAY